MFDIYLEASIDLLQSWTLLSPLPYLSVVDSTFEPPVRHVRARKLVRERLQFVLSLLQPGTSIHIAAYSPFKKNILLQTESQHSFQFRALEMLAYCRKSFDLQIIDF
jgi:hypothetical protein